VCEEKFLICIATTCLKVYAKARGLDLHRQNIPITV
jgi:hypothetical protein